ncbi:putative cell wall binding repeat 2-containing protein [Catenulispora acidiphila DSM 44928]|uniref:Putative cell wall binding repeat 2-containing protein n=1 Tax=Catenulispora acidiphila (strain DSM 44928 / JCM 14897 / NBRC 102108 / NRRL B-24433 / ID139908) TaxID=479433 RepID=C7PYC4_CATAD|nr:cell wall-binding repeat-containing protein [Catenulispora acidiphila]ACU75414.1 putative cell wall binding repeat 2-containing protein [Catenulispora acidiphila DSM 44928]
MSISALSIAALGAPMAAAADSDTTAPVTLRVGFTGTCSDAAPRADSALYCTLAGATAAAQPGDSVLVGELGATDKIAGSGAPGKPITVFSHYADQTFTDNSWQTVVSVTGQHDVVVRDIRLGGLDASGSSALTVNHVLVTPLNSAADNRLAPFGIRLSATTDSTVTDSHIDADNTDGTNLAVGILVENGSDRTTVSGTIIGEVYGTGIQVTDSKDVRLISDTAADDIAGVVLSGASTGAVVENDIFADGGPQPSLTVAATAIANTLVGHNLFGSGSPTTSVLWGTSAYATGQAFDSAHLGSADLDGAAQLDTSNDPDWPATPQEYFVAPSYRLTWNSPAIDSADAAVPGEPAVDRVDDPDVADTGSGPAGYVDRGAREFTGMQIRPFTATAALGVSPQDYLDATVNTDGMFQWSGPVSALYSYGDGSAATSQSTHHYPAAGTYHGTVTFTGQKGETATANFTASPAATKVTPAVSAFQPDANDPHLVSVSASWGPGATYDFEFGDGQSDKNNYTGYSDHRYAASGTYTVTVTVRDQNGWTGTASTQVTVTIPGGTPPPPPPAGAGGTVTRVGGRDRYETAIDASLRQFPGGTAKAVVLARGDAFADALAGGPLAARVGGPLLLTDPKNLGTPTAAEIDRALGHDHSRTVYLLGGESAISPAVEKQVRALGYRIVRYGGASRYDTALKIAQDGMGATATVVVARGDDFADALAAGPLAANRGAVLVLSNKNRLDPATAAFVQAHQTVIAVGGPAWDAVAKQIPAKGKQIETAVGNDRYATAANTVRLFHLSAVTLFGVATGTTFPDALSGGALMAAAGQPLLLTNPNVLPPDTAQQLTADGKRKENVTLFGGQAAISDFVEEQIAALVELRP